MLNTPTYGLIHQEHAMYGAANIPAIWPRMMENLLKDIENATNFFKTSFAETFHLLQLIEKVLDRFRKHRSVIRRI